MEKARSSAVCAALVFLLTSPPRSLAEEVALSTYIRTDSDTTVVYNPRLRLQLPLAETTSLDVVYGIDVWTSASVDIRTSASKTPVTDQRDERALGLAHEFADGTLAGG